MRPENFVGRVVLSHEQCLHVLFAPAFTFCVQATAAGYFFRNRLIRYYASFFGRPLWGPMLNSGLRPCSPFSSNIKVSLSVLGSS